MAMSPPPPSREQRPRTVLRLVLTSLGAWPRRRWLVALLVGVGAALVMGVPTGIIETSFYTRMTPVRWWDYPVWAASAILLGLTAATYIRVPGRADAVTPDRAGRALGGAVLTTFAVGCPICNKVVVALIGVGGTLSYWAPLQPVLGVLSIALLTTGLGVRLRGAPACPVAVTP